MLEGINNCLLALTLVFEGTREELKTDVKDIYSQEHRWEFPASDGRRDSYKVSLNSTSSFKRVPYEVIEYAPHAFENIRKLDGIT